MLHDLVTGERTRVAGFEDNRDLSPTDLELSTQTPSHWSPDASRLLLQSLPPHVVDVGTGRASPVGDAPGLAAGWTSPSTLLWLREDHEGGDPSGPLSGVTAVVTGLDGAVLREVPLQGAGTAVGDVSQWTGAVSPDGREVVLVDDAASSGRVQRYDLTTGAPVGVPVSAEVAGTCSTTWGARLVVPTTGAWWADGRAGAVALAAQEGRPEVAVVAEDREDARCVLWARDALAEPRGGLLTGTSTGWWTWWWPELLAGALAVALARYGWARWRRGSIRALRPRRRLRAEAPVTDWYA